MKRTRPLNKINRPHGDFSSSARCELFQRYFFFLRHIDEYMYGIFSFAPFYVALRTYRPALMRCNRHSYTSCVCVCPHFVAIRPHIAHVPANRVTYDVNAANASSSAIFQCIMMTNDALIFFGNAANTPRGPSGKRKRHEFV